MAIAFTLLRGAAAWPLAARAQQQPKMLNVGFVGIQPREAPVYTNFLNRMVELGYQEGRNFAFDWLYVAAVIDLFSRRVVGWSMSAAMTAQLVTDALVMAIWRRGKPDALLHHSDRGSQYTSEQFQKLMADHGIICSMSRSGNVWDNAAMESFFSSLKTERTARKTYRMRDQAKADVFDYIERFYNAKRRHSTIGYKSPMEFEMQAGLLLGGVKQ